MSQQAGAQQLLRACILAHNRANRPGFLQHGSQQGSHEAHGSQQAGAQQAGSQQTGSQQLASHPQQPRIRPKAEASLALTSAAATARPKVRERRVIERLLKWKGETLGRMVEVEGVSAAPRKGGWRRHDEGTPSPLTKEAGNLSNIRPYRRC